ncbi:hypothetical protein GALMADRAFT_236903 [Galerina marginata CBS 339.88]|uniref:Uncharacterized protein n=1 Tax=Galerina marginata (strain CBS 339.88) TaxID=685588 RepID=A0A067TM13_GALM3|nr:hypothetical protein GALMADRAFT_236903 [Galerina marginata CBS 339.88]
MSAENLPPQPNLATSDTNSVNPVDGPLIRFPPFPQPPDGVQIMSFKQFKERGIRVEPGPDDAEVDALGIPTIPLRVHHGTDECKTNTKRKRTQEENKTRKKGGLGAKKLVWWEQWEDTEAIRFSIGFNPHSSRFERIHAASADFTSGRTWPVTFASETGPVFIWDKFQRYIGLPQGGPVPGEKKKKKGKQQEVDEEMSDDDEMEQDDESPEAPAATRTGIFIDRQVPANMKANTDDEKLLTFFESPERSIRIFLSSYARKMGYIWSDANLDCMGRLLGFFVNFLLRSKVLPEVERSLRRSLDVITAAIKELPHTAALAKITPDNFSAACNNCWGRKSDGYTVLSLDLQDTPAADVPMAKIEEVEPEKPEPVANASGWGAATSGWGLVDGGAWGSSTADGTNVWGSATATDPVQEAAPWELAEQKSLMSLLGPTALPLTHTTGIVEQSMRRIKSITPPSSNPPKSPPLPDDATDPDAVAVEVELDRLFTKVVLEPMVDWDGGESPVYTRPSILESSQGAVVDPNAPAAADGAPKAHDPFKDEITLLVEAVPEKVDLMHVGMGLGGTWVQIVRQGEPVKKKKKGKSKSKKSVPSLWYLDELAVVTPSFWAISS